MSREPDDPTNPHRRRPPPIPDPEVGALERINAQISKDVARVGHMTDNLKQFMLYAFIAETGLAPSQIQLCQRTEPGRVVCWFEPKPTA